MSTVMSPPAATLDYAIADIRRKLHDPRGSKAVVIVGAGFSRNATRRTAGGPQFPLWQDITRGLAECLYPDERARAQVLARAGATSSALRMAQEYEAAFGRPSLIAFLRSLIQDEEFRPSDIHHQLLDLPW